LGEEEGVGGEGDQFRLRAAPPQAAAATEFSGCPKWAW